MRPVYNASGAPHGELVSTQNAADVLEVPADVVVVGRCSTFNVAATASCCIVRVPADGALQLSTQ